MKIRWTLADILDLEYLFACDEKTRASRGDRELRKRDRAVYLGEIMPKLKGKKEPPAKELLLHWLIARRRNMAMGESGMAKIPPGAVWHEVLSVLTWGALAFGLISGLGLAGAFLVYTGKAPLNVSAYLGIFVVLQLVFLVLQALFLIVRGRGKLAASPLYGLFMRLAGGFAGWLYARASRHVQAEKRLDFAAFIKRLRSRGNLAVLFAWPLFLLSQLAAIAFNIGVLGLTLAKVVFSDMAFGWQSSLQLSAGQVAHMVRAAALPWSWLLPEGTGFPSAAQVAGSQIILKNGVYHLATQDLVSWWPFLCMAVLVYGLLPRFLLFACGCWRYRARLAGYEIKNPEGRRLLQRMHIPNLETAGTDARPEAADEAMPEQALREKSGLLPDGDQPGPGEAAPKNAPLRAPASGVNLKRLIVVPEEMMAALDPEALILALQRQAGPGECTLRELPFDEAGEEALLAEMKERSEAAGLDELYLLQEAWMPPLLETRTLFERLRKAAGPAVPLAVFLVGKPRLNESLPPARPEDLVIWRKKMRVLGDNFTDVYTVEKSD